MAIGELDQLKAANGFDAKQGQNKPVPFAIRLEAIAPRVEAIAIRCL